MSQKILQKEDTVHFIVFDGAGLTFLKEQNRLCENDFLWIFTKVNSKIAYNVNAYEHCENSEKKFHF